MLILSSIVVAIHNFVLDIRGTDLDDEPKEYSLDPFALGTGICLLIIGVRIFIPLPLVRSRTHHCGMTTVRAGLRRDLEPVSRGVFV
jgi:hypothetical protein